MGVKTQKNAIFYKKICTYKKKVVILHPNRVFANRNDGMALFRIIC